MLRVELVPVTALNKKAHSSNCDATSDDQPHVSVLQVSVIRYLAVHRSDERRRKPRWLETDSDSFSSDPGLASRIYLLF
jgi:hypothetical protein